MTRKALTNLLLALTGLLCFGLVLYLSRMTTVSWALLAGIVACFAASPYAMVLYPSWHLPSSKDQDNFFLLLALGLLLSGPPVYIYSFFVAGARPSGSLFIWVPSLQWVAVLGSALLAHLRSRKNRMDED